MMMMISSWMLLMMVMFSRSVCGDYEATTRPPYHQPPRHRPPQPYYPTTRPPHYRPPMNYPTTRRPHYQPYQTTSRPYYQPHPTTRRPHYPPEPHPDYVQRLLNKQEEIHALLEKTYQLALYLCKLLQNLFFNRSGTEPVAVLSWGRGAQAPQILPSPQIFNW